MHEPRSSSERQEVIGEAFIKIETISQSGQSLCIRVQRFSRRNVRQFLAHLPRHSSYHALVSSQVAMLVSAVSSVLHCSSKLLLVSRDR